MVAFFTAVAMTVLVGPCEMPPFPSPAMSSIPPSIVPVEVGPTIEEAPIEEAPIEEAPGADPSPVAAESGPAKKEDPNLLWRDEFDGDSLDLRKWEYRQLGVRRDAVNVKEAVSLDGKGHLVITTRKVGSAFHTGMIGTQGKFERAFGYFECRVKLQTQEGHWSAFWLQSPRMGAKALDPAKDGAEIDIFEYLSTRGDKLQHTLHWGGYGEGHRSAKHVHEAPGLKEGWHTVGVEWTEAGYAFFVDGKETWRTEEGVSRIPQYIILSLEVGKWAGDISRADLPDSVVFDYVRVYAVRPSPGGSR